MINSELSHRLANVAETLMGNGMSFEDKYKLSRMANKAKDFDELPEHYKIAVLRAENKFKLNYGTSEGLKKAWDTRGRGRKEIESDIKNGKRITKSEYKQLKSALASKAMPNQDATISALTDRSASLFRPPPYSRLGENSKYLKSLDNYIKQQDGLYNTVEAHMNHNRDFNMKFDDLRRKHGFDPNSPEDLLRETDNKEYVAEHEKLKAEYEKRTIKFEKQREYYRGAINTAYSQMAKDFMEERVKETIESDGVITHGQKVTPATIYRFDNMQIVKDKNSNTDISDLYFKVQSMPVSLRNRVGKIEVLDYRNPDDLKWAAKTGFPGFTSAGAAGGGKLIFFQQGEQVSETILAHEAAHLLDDSEGNYGKLEQGKDPEKYYYLSDDEDEASRADIMFKNKFDSTKKVVKSEPAWSDVMNEDNKLPQKYDLKGYVSDYAALQGTTYTGKEAYRSRREDFAESVSMYMTNHGSFAHKFPNRAKFIDKYIKGDIDYLDGEMTARVKEVIKE